MSALPRKSSSRRLTALLVATAMAGALGGSIQNADAAPKPAHQTGVSADQRVASFGRSWGRIYIPIDNPDLGRSWSVTGELTMYGRSWKFTGPPKPSPTKHVGTRRR